MKTWPMKLVVAAVIVYMTVGTILLSVTLTLAYRSSSSVNNLILSGKTPAAVRAGDAATVDKELLCAVLKPALHSRKATAAQKAIIRKDCK